MGSSDGVPNSDEIRSLPAVGSMLTSREPIRPLFVLRVANTAPPRPAAT